MFDNGLAKLQKRLAAIPKQIKADVQPSLIKGAEDMVATMKTLVARESGDLAESIAITPAGQSTPAYSQPGGSMVVPDNAVAITVGNTKVRYAHLVEFGSAPHVNAGLFAGTMNPGAPAQPFFWPSYRLHRKKVIGRVKRAISKAVRKK